jgi:hypothetical protein
LSRMFAFSRRDHPFAFISVKSLEYEVDIAVFAVGFVKKRRRVCHG